MTITDEERARLAAHAAEIVATAPPITEKQRNKIADLLRVGKELVGVYRPCN